MTCSTRLSFSLITVFVCLLALAASARAECAWVLWQEEQIALFDQSGRPNDPVSYRSVTAHWVILGAYPSRETCLSFRESAHSSHADRMRKDRDRGWIVKDGKTIGSSTWDAQCIPDTIDPRGPKGK